METNNIINIPEGYEIDKEQYTERQIVLRKIENKSARSWKEYCEKMKGKNSYFYNNAIRRIVDSQFGSEPVLSEFEDMEDVETLEAFSKLLRLRKDWVGEWKPDWTNEDQTKFTIISAKNKIDDSIGDFINRSMSFPTKEMRNEFIVTFKDLLEIAKPLL